VLKEEDFNAMNRGGYRPQLGFQRGSHYRPKNSNSMQAAGRFVRSVQVYLLNNNDDDDDDDDDDLL